MSDTRLGYIAVVFLLLSVLLGVASTTYGYVLYNRITVYNPPYMEVDFPDRTWVVGLSLFWTLSPGDKVNLSMEFDPRIDPSSIFLDVAAWYVMHGVLYSTGPQSRTNTTDLASSWNHTYAQWSVLKEGILVLNFTVTHFYNLRVYMYVNASANSLPNGESPPRLFFVVVYRNPDDQAGGLFFRDLGIFLFAMAPSPFVWRVLKKKHWAWLEKLRRMMTE